MLLPVDFPRPIALQAASLLIALLSLAGCANRELKYVQPRQVGEELVINAEAIPEDMPEFYSFADKGRTVRFFVLRTSDGMLAFFDACLKCYPKKRGYEFEDAAFYCRNCGERFPVYGIERGMGSCVPIRMEGGYLSGKEYRIPIASVVQMADKF